MTTRELHEHIRKRIDFALGGRSWNWLAKAAGVPQSTLASQAAKPKFSVEVVVRVCEALEKQPSYLLPMSDAQATTPSQDALERINQILAAASEVEEEETEQ